MLHYPAEPTCPRFEEYDWYDQGPITCKLCQCTEEEVDFVDGYTECVECLKQDPEVKAELIAEGLIDNV